LAKNDFGLVLSSVLQKNAAVFGLVLVLQN